jgi:hypothetical protein
MTDDLVKRLRSEHGTLAELIEASLKAADTIEAQAAEIERLREALTWIEGYCRTEYALEYNDAMRKVFQRNMADKARAALGEPTGE